MLGEELSHYSLLCSERPQSPVLNVSLPRSLAAVEVAYLVMSAARRPADVMTRVCGLPVFFDAVDRLLPPSVLEL